MARWLAEFILRIVAIAWLLDALGEGLFTAVTALAVGVGSLPWLAPKVPFFGRPVLARIAHAARRLHGPPEGNWETAANATSGWSRVTFRSGVVATALFSPTRDAALFAILAALLLWIVDGASQLARWLHPSREEAGAALGGYDPVRFFQRSFDGALWLALWPAIIWAAFGDTLIILWLERAAPPGMVQLFAAVVPLAAVAFVTGQWLHGRGGAGLVANVVRLEALIVLALTLATWLYLGALAPLFALVVAHLLMSGSRFSAACCREIGVRPLPWLARRIGIALAVSGPALTISVGTVVARPPKNVTELVVIVLIVSIAQGVSTAAWWNLSSRRGW
jgi:hypothetical protein